MLNPFILYVLDLLSEIRKLRAKPHNTLITVLQNDDLLVYIVSSLVLTPTPVLVLVKSPITKVYSRRQNPPVSSPTPVASS